MNKVSQTEKDILKYVFLDAITDVSDRWDIGFWEAESFLRENGVFRQIRDEQLGWVNIESNPTD